MHKGKLKDRGENKGEREEHEEVQSRGIGNFRQIRSRLQAQESHGQNRRDSERHAISGGFPVQPEGHPGEDDQQNARTVDLNEKIAHVSLQVKAHDKHGVLVLGCKEKIMEGVSINK